MCAYIIYIYLEYAYLSLSLYIYIYIMYMRKRKFLDNNIKVVDTKNISVSLAFYSETLKVDLTLSLK